VRPSAIFLDAALACALRISAWCTGLGVLAALMAGCGAPAGDAAPAPAPSFTCIVIPNTAATSFTDNPQVMTARITVTIPGDGQSTDFGSFEVVYYDKSGNEMGSANLFGVGYVTPGQTISTAMDASQDAPAGAGVCQVVSSS
jgi:hypothetical protein